LEGPPLTRHGANAEGNAELVTGLWLDVEVEFRSIPDFTWWCSCSDPPNTYGTGFPPALCAEACGEMTDLANCGHIGVPIKINTVRFKLGFVPERREGCDPLRTINPLDAPDPRLAWMEHFPEGKAYRQDCLVVRPVLAWGFRREPFVHIFEDAFEVNTYHGPGMAAAPDLGNCSTAAHMLESVACTLFDCQGMIQGEANQSIESVVRDALGTAIAREVLPFFQYGEADGPFAAPSNGPGCPLIDSTSDQDVVCHESIRSDMLPASLTYRAYDWLAAPFAPIGPQSSGQFPVHDVRPRCPAGSTAVTAPTPTKQGTAARGDCVTPDWPLPHRVAPVIHFDYLADPDGDGLVGLDNCPFVHNPSQADSDGDGVGNECDICPSRNNPDQDEVDLDGDGIPEACERPDQCPCDPVNDSSLPQDNDGVCNYCDGRLGGPGSFCASYCGGEQLSAIDNCPVVDNPDQRNCNADAERARDASVMGDACDPVPCALFVPEHRGEILDSREVGSSSGYNIFLDTVSWIELSGIRMVPVGSHRSTGFSFAPGATSFPPEQRMVQADTEYRACVDLGEPANVVCRIPANIANRFITETDNVGAETQLSVWHRVWMQGVTKPGTASNGSDWNPLDPGVKYLYDESTVMNRVWNWKEDYLRWSQGWGAGTVPAKPSNPGEGVARFWVHGRTNVGESEDPFGFGLHAMPVDNSGMHAADRSRLVNHYQTTPPVSEEITARRLLKSLFIGPWDFFFGRPCLDCPIEPSWPGDNCLDCGPMGSILGQIDPYEVNVIVVLPQEYGGGLGVLRRDGQLQMVTHKLSQRLRDTLESGATLVGSVEPSTSVGAGSSAPAGVALSPDGTQVLDHVVQRRGSFVTQRDAMGDAELPVPLSSTSVQPWSTASAPAPRTGFQAVYSQAAARTFLVGGTDAATGLPTRDIWWNDVASGAWSKVPLEGYTPGKVNAATYSYREGKLWVLDEVAMGPISMARLTRVDPVTGTTEEVGRWPRLRLGSKWVFDRHWLALDQDGAVLLVASSAMTNKHVIVRLQETGAGARVDGVRIGQFALAGPPAVDGSGYTLLLERKGKVLPELKRLQTLGAKPGKWLDVGGCL